MPASKTFWLHSARLPSFRHARFLSLSRLVLPHPSTPLRHPSLSEQVLGAHFGRSGSSREKRPARLKRQSRLEKAKRMCSLALLLPQMCLKTE